MAPTPVRSRAPILPSQHQPRRSARTASKQRRRGLRFWYVPLLLAVVLPLLLWAGLNVAVVVFANRDLAGTAAPAALTPTPAPDQPLLDAAIKLVQDMTCLPASSAIKAQPAFARANWIARRSEADPHAYYVAATDATTEQLLGIWQVEGGQVARLQADQCSGIPAGTPARLAEAAVLFSVHHVGSGIGQ